MQTKIQPSKGWNGGKILGSNQINYSQVFSFLFPMNKIEIFLPESGSLGAVLADCLEVTTRIVAAASTFVQCYQI